MDEPSAARWPDADVSYADRSTRKTPTLPLRPETARSWWGRVAPWFTPALAVADLVLVRSGVLSVSTAIWVFVGFEIVLWSTLITRVVSGSRRYRASRADGNTRWNAAEDGLSRLMPPGLARIMLYEPRLWFCLLRWAARRIPRGNHRFAYVAPLRISFALFVGLTVFEAVVVDAILVVVLGAASIWTWVALLVHVYSIVWLAGWYASCVVLPHQLETDVLRLRDGLLSEVVIPRGAIRGARRKTVSNFFRSGFKWIDEDAGHAKFTAGDGNVVITVERDTTITANRVPHRIRTIAVTAEDPDALIAALTANTTPDRSVGQRAGAA